MGRNFLKRKRRKKRGKRGEFFVRNLRKETETTENTEPNIAKENIGVCSRPNPAPRASPTPSARSGSGSTCCLSAQSARSACTSHWRPDTAARVRLGHRSPFFVAGLYLSFIVIPRLLLGTHIALEYPPPKKKPQIYIYFL